MLSTSLLIIPALIGGSPLDTTEVRASTVGHQVTFQRERVHDLWPEVLPLLKEHYDEIAQFKDIDLDPDVDVYNATEELGHLRCFTARQRGELIGYAVYFIRRNPHYKQSLQATGDVVFLRREHRRGRLGFNLLAYADTVLRGEGTQVVCHHVKLEHPQMGRVLEAMEYVAIETIYARRLDHGR